MIIIFFSLNEVTRIQNHFNIMYLNQLYQLFYYNLIQKMSINNNDSNIPDYSYVED